MRCSVRKNCCYSRKISRSCIPIKVPINQTLLSRMSRELLAAWPTPLSSPLSLATFYPGCLLAFPTNTATKMAAQQYPRELAPILLASQQFQRVKRRRQQPLVSIICSNLHTNHIFPIKFLKEIPLAASGGVKKSRTNIGET